MKFFEKVLRVAKNPSLVLKKVLVRFETPTVKARHAYSYDFRVFREFSGALNLDGREALIAQITMAFHVLEKGLTMPRRRLQFGQDAVIKLIELIERFEKMFERDPMVDYAIGVVKAYLKMHRDANIGFHERREFWDRVTAFCESHPGVPVSEQIHCSREAFFSKIDAPFPEFAASRHTCRHYSGEISIKTIEDSVCLAMTAPSACDRQHARVYCVANQKLKDEVLSSQHGNRGFGSDADKVLIVTADLRSIRWAEERNDLFTNAGIFIMNLSYALHYNKVAHCILNWSVGEISDRALHKLVGIPECERIAAIIACGGMPEEVDIAASPRKPLDHILHIVS